jgi:hypothetical protein
MANDTEAASYCMQDRPSPCSVTVTQQSTHAQYSSTRTVSRHAWATSQHRRSTAVHDRCHVHGLWSRFACQSIDHHPLGSRQVCVPKLTDCYTSLRQRRASRCFSAGVSMCCSGRIPSACSVHGQALVSASPRTSTLSSSRYCAGPKTRW